MSIDEEDLRVRFAPSPTGALHVGGARTALYNWLAARHAGGRLVLRIEDTDLERSTDANVDQILDALEWLGIDWDEGPVSQRGRAAEHGAALRRLLEAGKAYHDPATAQDVRRWKELHGSDRGYRGAPGQLGEGAVRLRVPDEGDTVVRDLIRGEVRFANRHQDDFVIARADGSVLYNFAVAVDDADMQITEVIRGDDHLSNTPKQLLVLEALGAEPPRYAHVPLLHGPDGKKLSKRHGAASVQELRDAGYIAAAVRNYVALLGWGPGDDETLLDTAELVARFSPADVGRSSAVFDEKKLRWMNGRYLRDMDLDEYTAAAAAFTGREPDAELRGACAIAREKAQTLAEVWPLVRFLFEEPVDDEKAWRKTMKNHAPAALEAVRAALAGLEPFDADSVESAMDPIPASLDLKPGKVYQPVRVALTGTTVSPGIFESVAALGREESIARIDEALDRLAASPPEPGAPAAAG